MSFIYNIVKYLDELLQDVVNSKEVDLVLKMIHRETREGRGGIFTDGLV